MGNLARMKYRASTLSKVEEACTAGASFDYAQDASRWVVTFEFQQRQTDTGGFDLALGKKWGGKDGANTTGPGCQTNQAWRALHDNRDASLAKNWSSKPMKNSNSARASACSSAFRPMRGDEANSLDKSTGKRRRGALMRNPANRWHPPSASARAIECERSTPELTAAESPTSRRTNMAGSMLANAWAVSLYGKEERTDKIAIPDIIVIARAKSSCPLPKSYVILNT